MLHPPELVELNQHERPGGPDLLGIEIDLEAFGKITRDLAAAVRLLAMVRDCVPRHLGEYLVELAPVHI